MNGIDLRMASHEEALSVLRLSPQHVRLCVYRHAATHTFHNQATHTHEDMWDLFTVELQLQPGQKLGLCIVGKRYKQHTSEICKSLARLLCPDYYTFDFFFKIPAAPVTFMETL